MTMCQRLRCERVSIAEIDGVDEPESRARVRSYVRSMKRGEAVPFPFVMRINGEVTLVHGAEQIVAAAQLRRRHVTAVVFEPADVQEENRVGAWGYGIAGAGMDVWRGLLLCLRHFHPADAGAALGSCSVTLLPGMSAADARDASARVREAGIEALTG